MDLEIGGQLIDRHYGHWHSAYSQLTEFNPSGAAFGGEIDVSDATAVTQGTLFQKMSGNGNSIESQNNVVLNTTSLGGWNIISTPDQTAAQASGKFWIPLYFWFCRNPGLALPLIALNTMQLKLKSTESLIKLTLSAF